MVFYVLFAMVTIYIIGSVTTTFIVVQRETGLRLYSIYVIRMVESYVIVKLCHVIQKSEQIGRLW